MQCAINAFIVLTKEGFKVLRSASITTSCTTLFGKLGRILLILLLNVVRDRFLLLMVTNLNSQFYPTSNGLDI